MSVLLSVLLLLTAQGSVRAAAQGEPQQPAQPSGQRWHAARRSLLQDALGNSNGCLATIPKCEAGACATRDVQGVARWVCLRCLTNYAPVVDASGQDNIIQCVCPRGSFEAAANASSCERCPANSFCPGGDMVEAPGSRGTAFSCGSYLITRSTGARSQVDCVAPAGFAFSSPVAATPCNSSEYAPPFNRLARCLRCQSGLAEDPGLNLTASQRSSKRAVCHVPPGRYTSQGLVRICPQGFYRENFANYSDAVAQICLPCNPGITTDGAGAGSVSLCNKVLPGYGISNVVNVNGPADIPALPSTNGTGLPNATLCDIGFYSLGGRCAQCPGGTVTTVKGAKSVEECVVPPGYHLAAAGAMPRCGNGTFREGWVMYSDPKAANCTPCGDGIASEPRDLDAHPLAQNGSLVRATSASCYIEAGMGMIAQGKNLFVGTDCPANTYGAAGRVYGWAAAPCKPCPRNMITDGATRVNNSDVCINDDGFGYASEGASRCAPGFYSAKGSRKPCQQCPAGRTTSGVAAEQRLPTDCFVRAGFGVVNSTANASDAFSPDLMGLGNASLAALPVMECPLGYFGAGGSAGAKCAPCPGGSSTEAPGATSAANCTVCLPGFGKANLTDAACAPCDYGTFQPGGGVQCLPCPNTTFMAPVDGAGDPFTSNGTTFYTGSSRAEACVPRQSQLSPEAGQAFFAPGAAVNGLLSTVPGVASLPACLALCGSAGSACMAQWEAAAQTCKTVLLAPAAYGATAGVQLLYKLPPSTLGSASSLAPGAPSLSSQQGNGGGSADGSGGISSSQGQGQQQQQQQQSAVQARMMSSGYYARADVAVAAAAWATAGASLGADARAFAPGPGAWDNGTTVARCQARCDASNVCWGFLWEPSGAGACLYRGGVDALGTRAFFVLPSNAAVTAQWVPQPAGGPAQGAPVPGVNPCTTPSNPCASVVNSTGACTQLGGQAYTCGCAGGFAWNGTACADVDECKSANPCSYACTNTVGGFVCGCPSGYVLGADGRSCTGAATSAYLSPQCPPLPALSIPPPAWMQLFDTRNNVTWDANGTVTLGGASTWYPTQLACSSSLISNMLYDGDISLRVNVSSWAIAQSGYQAYVNLFFAPLNYTGQIGNYLTWAASDNAVHAQYASAMTKIFDQAGNTWSTLGVQTTGASASLTLSPRMQQGVLGISRTAGQASGFVQIGNGPVNTFQALPMPSGPVLVGVQILYGYFYSIGISSISVTAGATIPYR